MLGKFTDEIIKQIIEEIKKDENQKQIKLNIVDPLVYHILDKLYPYILVTSAIFVLILLIALSILFLVINK